MRAIVKPDSAGLSSSWPYWSQFQKPFDGLRITLPGAIFGNLLRPCANLANFRSESKFSTWMLQITYNEAKMKLRKARSHLYESLDDQQQTDEGDYYPRDFADWRPIPCELLEESETRQAIQNAIASLSPCYREVLILRDLQNLSIKETMTILGLSKAAVKTRLQRARLPLTDRLAPGIDGSWIKGQDYRKVRSW